MHVELTGGYWIGVEGRIGKEIRTTLGSGGAPIRVRTTNGGVTVSNR